MPNPIGTRQIYRDLTTRKLVLVLALSPTTVVWRYLGTAEHILEHPHDFANHVSVDTSSARTPEPGLL